MSIKNSENVLDNWEEIDETMLNTKLEQLKKDNSCNKMNTNMKICLLRPDDDRTPFGQPEASVKILRRPTQNNDDKLSLDSNKPKAPKKTLQQREQEYAEARLRILGSARSPDEDLTEQNGLTSPTIRSPNILTNGLPIAAPSSPNLGQNENVIRMPKGPDGTAGFKIRR